MDCPFCRIAAGTTKAHVIHRDAHAHVVPLLEKTDITSTAYIDAERIRFHPAPRADADRLAETANRFIQALA